MNLPPRSSRNHAFRLPVAIAVAAGLIAAAAISGCGEEPPPPPPPKKEPPPPPPPPPPEISIPALLQDMKADARVSFADTVTITDEPLARAVISLADGFARGDGPKLKGVLDDGAQYVLSSLDASGEWANSTAGIEAVRVVYVGDAGEAKADSAAEDPLRDLGPTAMGDFMRTLDSDPELQKAVTTAIFSFEWAELMKKEEKLKGAKEVWGRVVEKLKAQGFDSAKIEKLEKAVDAIDQKTADALFELGEKGRNNSAPLVGVTFDRVVVLAMQDAKGAYLLGWGVGDSSGNVRFSSAATAGVTKPRASDFDNIGTAAFGDGKPKGEAADHEGKDKDEKKADDPGALPANAPGLNEPPPKNPRRKSTPGGPITVPGGG
jgi:hypothetical protein